MSADLQFPIWQAPLQEAILEFDNAELTPKLRTAEALIFERMKQLHQNGQAVDELEALRDGLRLLRQIRSDRLNCTA
jgi:hypothetical protein